MKQVVCSSCDFKGPIVNPNAEILGLHRAAFKDTCPDCNSKLEIGAKNDK